MTEALGVDPMSEKLKEVEELSHLIGSCSRRMREHRWEQRKWLPTNFAARGSRVSHFTQSCLGFSSNLVPLVEVGSKAILHPSCISGDYTEETRLFGCFAL